ncbi:carboxypeptidase-like regulatory domain-containing protein [Sphingobacterium sp. HMA12]|uniref:carboxypeptidase-like regulatory domain-containing protein n=1 Tax=Sphingobacterium sp. HMA12 TaxID=2050894 RepID=UPI000CE9F47F|nr:carboxypeptidase-like regulatory domain-containing protein [Sphingobacterium sp. HMA12]
MISKILGNQKLSLLSLTLLFAGVNASNAGELNYSHTLVLNNTIYQQKVTGKVQGTEGPLAGVTITVKGSSRSTSTDSNGQFSIEAKTGDVLLVKSIGYKPQEISVSSSVVTIDLISDSEALEEVVVVAYGTQKKANLTGSVATITPKQLADRPVTSL